MSYVIVQPYYYANKPTCPRCGVELKKPKDLDQFDCESCAQTINWANRKGEAEREERRKARMERKIRHIYL